MVGEVRFTSGRRSKVSSSTPCPVVGLPGVPSALCPTMLHSVLCSCTVLGGFVFPLFQQALSAQWSTYVIWYIEIPTFCFAPVAFRVSKRPHHVPLLEPIMTLANITVAFAEMVPHASPSERPCMHVCARVGDTGIVLSSGTSQPSLRTSLLNVTLKR